jgi:hypothetical protein
MDEPPAAAADMATHLSRLEGAPTQGSSRAGSRDGLRRKAHPEPLPSLAARGAPRTLCAPPLQRRVSLDPINGATMRLCRADLPGTADLWRLEAAPTQRSSSPSLPLGDKDARIRAPAVARWDENLHNLARASRRSRGLVRHQVRWVHPPRFDRSPDFVVAWKHPKVDDRGRTSLRT